MFPCLFFSFCCCCLPIWFLYWFISWFVYLFNLMLFVFQKVQYFVSLYFPVHSFYKICIILCSQCKSPFSNICHKRHTTEPAFPSKASYDQFVVPQKSMNIEDVIVMYSLRGECSDRQPHPPPHFFQTFISIYIITCIVCINIMFWCEVKSTPLPSVAVTKIYYYKIMSRYNDHESWSLLATAHGAIKNDKWAFYYVMEDVFALQGKRTKWSPLYILT